MSSAIFATLSPLNQQAKQAFSEAVEAIEASSEKSELKQALKFMDFTKAQQQMFEEVSDDFTGDDFAGLSETEAEDAPNTPRLPKYQGHFVMSFDTAPTIPQIGWLIGIGRRRDGKSTGGVEMQLASPITPFSKYQIAGRHARLYFNDSGSLILGVVSTRSPTVILGHEEFHCGQRVILERKSLVMFGSLSYYLEFVKKEPEEYQRDLREYFDIHLNLQAPPPDISASPSPSYVTIGDWQIRGTVGKGSSGTVSAAVHRKTGVAAAAKMLVRDTRTHPVIQKEIQLLKSLPNSLHLLKFLHVEYEREDHWYTGVQDENDERSNFPTRPEKVYIFCEPFARGTLSDIFLDMSVPTRLKALWQILTGVSVLGEAGYIHRDIKPANIGIVKFSKVKNEVQIVILDFGSTVKQDHCDAQPGHVGTVPYLAPEMETTKYTKQVDVWACGIIALQLMVTHGALPWKHVVRGKPGFVAGKLAYEEKIAMLQKTKVIAVHGLISGLLAWDPKERFTSSAALEHSTFYNLSEVEKHVGQKRDRAE